MLELRGDEALCVFGSPRSAIRAAVALQERFVEETIADPSLPLTVGIGWTRVRPSGSKGDTAAVR